MKCDGTRAETTFRLSSKRTSPFKSAGVSVQSTTGSRGVRSSGSNAGYTKFRGCVKGTGYPLLSPVSPSLTLPCVTVCHHISAGLYQTLLQYGRELYIASSPCLQMLTYTHALSCHLSVQFHMCSSNGSLLTATKLKRQMQICDG